MKVTDEEKATLEREAEERGAPSLSEFLRDAVNHYIENT